MVDNAIERPAPRPVTAAEAAEIRDWRAERARRLPRRARVWTWRFVAFCVGALLLLGALDQVVTLATSSGGGAPHVSAPSRR